MTEHVTQLGYDQTINWYDLVKSLTSSFGLVTSKLFPLQLPPCPDPSRLFRRVRTKHADEEEDEDEEDEVPKVGGVHANPILIPLWYFKLIVSIS